MIKPLDCTGAAEIRDTDPLVLDEDRGWSTIFVERVYPI